MDNITKLKDLVNEDAQESILKTRTLHPDSHVKQLTLEQLSELGMIIMRSEKLLKVPCTILSCYAIEYLIEKAIEKQLPIF